MRKIILFDHVSLDGFAAGPAGEMDWILLSDEMFDFVGTLTQDADAALYGRKTYEMMDNYWPTAGDEPNASKHDVEHSKWYNSVEKLVLSNSMKDVKKNKTKFISGEVAKQITDLKKQSGKNILMLGSLSAGHVLMAENLIDEYWLFVNPILLGKGIPVFNRIPDKTALALAGSKVFPTGVIAINYTLSR